MMIGPLSCCRNGHRSGAARIYLVCDIIFMDLLHSRSIFIAGPALQLIWHIDKFFLFHDPPELVGTTNNDSCKISLDIHSGCF